MQYRSSYQVARFTIRLIAAVGWIAFACGGFLAFSALAGGAGDGAKLLTLAGVSLAGLFFVAGGQILGALADIAENTGKLVALQENEQRVVMRLHAQGVTEAKFKAMNFSPEPSPTATDAPVCGVARQESSRR